MKHNSKPVTLEGIESGFFYSSNKFDNKSSGYADPELIYASHKTRLYRLKLRGKYFMAKTYAGDRAHSIDVLTKEFELASSCSHPNIVHVYTLEPSSPVGEAIIMEYVEARNLLEFLDENPSQKMRERIVDQLLSTVDYLHRKGIIHNDLKPENLLVTRSDNSLRLIDFDLADDPTHYLIKNLGCTPCYAAPELINKQQSDRRSDIYSIGELIRLICGGDHKRIVAKCTQSFSEKRFQDIPALRAKWDKRNSKLNSAIPVISLVFILLVMSGYLFAIRNPESQKLDYTEGLKDPIPNFTTVSSDKNEEKSVITSQGNAETIYEGNNIEKKEILTQSQVLNTSPSTKPDSPSPSEEMFKEIDIYNDATLNITEGKLKESRYNEFALLQIKNFSEDIIANYDKYLSITKDEELKNLISKHKMIFLSTHGDKLQEYMKNLPSLFSLRDEMDENEFNFYLQLLANQEDYRPYTP